MRVEIFFMRFMRSLSGQLLIIGGVLLITLATLVSAARLHQDLTQDFSKNTWDLPADFDETKNPIKATAESITQGKELFMTPKGNCIFCHGETGAGNEANLPKLRRKPADLSDGKRMSKLPDGEVYWKITRGITGIMPTYDDPKLTAEERWHLVNFVKTLSRSKTQANLVVRVRFVERYK